MNAELYAKRADVHRCLKEYNLTIDNYKTASRLDSSNVEYYKNSASAKYAIDDIQGAINDYTSALAQDYKNDSLYAQRGFYKLLKKMYKSAKEDYLSAIKYNPNKAHYYYMLGCAEELNNDTSDAEIHFKKYKELTA